MATFHFVSRGGASPSNQVRTDMAKLNALDANMFLAMFETILDFAARAISHRTLTDTLDELAGEYQVSSNAVRNILRAVLHFVRGAVRANLPPTYFRDDLITFGVDDDKAAKVAQLWKSRLVAISRATAASTLMVNELVDLEWKFGVTTASSEAERVGTVFLQLKLTLDEGNGKTRTVPLELTLPQFYNFMREMEKAKANMDYFGA